MARLATVVEVFLSSPSDVAPERKKILSHAREWNQLRGKSAGIYLDILLWEDVASAVGVRPQAVINESIGDEYDVYLGLMWGRFGSPTGTASSGTVEEFDRTLSRYRQGSRVRLSMIFKSNDIPQNQLNGTQFDQVQEFKRRFSEEGGVYHEFSDDDQLRRICFRIFEEIVKESWNIPETISQDSKINETAVGQLSTGLQDIGLLDITDELSTVVESITRFLSDYTKINIQTNSIITESTEQMNADISSGSVSQSRLKPIISRIAGSFDNMSTFLIARLAEFSADAEKLVAVTEAGLDLSRDFNEDDERAFRESIRSAAETLEETTGQLEGMISKLDGIPRLSSELNLAKRRLSEMQGSLLAELKRTSSSLSNSVRPITAD